MPQSLSQYYDATRAATAAMALFNACMDVVLRHEGGFVNHPDDPGGATNLGITKKVLEAWRGRALDVSDVKLLGLAEAKTIYHAQYWVPIQGDRLPKGVSMVVFCMAVNAGVTRASKILQKIVGVEQDGHVGVVTLQAVSQYDPEQLIRDYSQARLTFYKKLKHWPTFKNGWTRRIKETEGEALKMRDSGLGALPPTTDTTLQAEMRQSSYVVDGSTNPLAALIAFIRRLLS